MIARPKVGLLNRSRYISANRSPGIYAMIVDRAFITIEQGRLWRDAGRAPDPANAETSRSKRHRQNSVDPFGELVLPGHVTMGSDGPQVTGDGLIRITDDA